MIKFNIYVVQEDNALKLKVEMICDQHYAKLLAWRLTCKPFVEGIQKGIEKTSCAITKSQPINIDQGDEHFALTTITYPLPANVDKIKYLVQAITEKIKEEQRDRPTIHHEECVVVIAGQKIDSDIVANIIKSIIDVNPHPSSYVETINSLNNLYKCEILVDSIAEKIIDTSIEMATKLQLLFECIRLHTKLDITYNLKGIFDKINQLAKNKLYELCFDKTSYHGKKHHTEFSKYNYHYTELHLIREAQFTLRPDGRMSIPLSDNTIYQEFYTVGRVNHDIMRDEFNFLANILNLAFSPDNDFHRDKEMIFTKESTEKLKALGLHLNLQYVKQLLSVKHRWSLFKQGYTHETNNEGKTCHFYQFPPEIMSMIMNKVSLAQEEELQAVQALSFRPN